MTVNPPFLAGFPFGVRPCVAGVVGTEASVVVRDVGVDVDVVGVVGLV